MIRDVYGEKLQRQKLQLTFITSLAPLVGGKQSQKFTPGIGMLALELGVFTVKWSRNNGGRDYGISSWLVGF